MYKFPQRKSCGHIEALSARPTINASTNFRNAKVAATLKPLSSLMLMALLDSYFRNAKVAATLKQVDSEQRTAAW